MIFWLIFLMSACDDYNFNRRICEGDVLIGYDIP